MTLSIPVEKAKSDTAPMRDTRISDHGHWRHLHWNAILSAYNSTPFFPYYEDEFRPFTSRESRSSTTLTSGYGNLSADLSASRRPFHTLPAILSVQTRTNNRVGKELFKKTGNWKGNDRQKEANNRNRKGKQNRVNNLTKATKPMNVSST